MYNIKMMKMGKEEKKVTRRDYLKYTGAGIGGLIVGGALGYVLKPSEVVERTVTAPGVERTVTITKTETIGLTPVAPKYTVYYVDHGIAGNPFWVVYFKGQEEAAKRYPEIKLVHMSSEADTRKQIDMLKTAVAAKPDAIITSMIDPASFDPILRPAIEEGIAVFAANVEDPREDRIPYLTYWGERTWESGVVVANALIRYIKETGGFKPKHVLLCIPMAGHYVWEARLKKFAETLSKEYGSTSEKIVIGEDPAKAMELTRAYYEAHPETNVAIGTCWSIVNDIKILKELGRVPGKDIYLCAFDLMPELLEAIKRGEVVATHDQQQYLQGYLPIEAAYLYLKNYKMHPYGDVATGPLVVDRHNVDTVIEGSKAGYR